MGELIHRVRNSIVDRERDWTLGADALQWREADGKAGRVAYADIAGLQLIDYASYGGRIYQCALKPKSGAPLKIRSHSYISLGNFEDRRQTYAPLIHGLAGRVAAANPDARFIAGSTGLWIAWTLVGLLTLVMLGVFFASLGAGSLSINAGAVALVIAILAVPLVWRQVKSGRAKTFDPKNVPPALIGEAT
ncbi:MAG: hypothetical protein ACPW61_02525 [Methyloligella sp. ZOD6]